VPDRLRPLWNFGDLDATEQLLGWAHYEAGEYHEELAEDYAALGRDAKARAQARLALPLLLAEDPSFADNEARAERLRRLADFAK
jgi:hypothetical protein